MLERGEVRDPGLAGITLTVTEVRMSPDLRHATAFVVPLGGGGGEGALQALARAAHQAGIEAILVPSAAAANQLNAVIFPENLARRGAVKVLDPSALT